MNLLPLGTTLFRLMSGSQVWLEAADGVWWPGCDFQSQNARGVRCSLLIAYLSWSTGWKIGWRLILCAPHELMSDIATIFCYMTSIGMDSTCLIWKIQNVPPTFLYGTPRRISLAFLRRGLHAFSMLRKLLFVIFVSILLKLDKGMGIMRNDRRRSWRHLPAKALCGLQMRWLMDHL